MCSGDVSSTRQQSISSMPLKKRSVTCCGGDVDVESGWWTMDGGSMHLLVVRSNVRLSRGRGVTTGHVGPLAVGSGLSPPGDSRRAAADSVGATSTLTSAASSTFVRLSSSSAAATCRSVAVPPTALSLLVSAAAADAAADQYTAYINFVSPQVAAKNYSKDQNSQRHKRKLN